MIKRKSSLLDFTRSRWIASFLFVLFFFLFYLDYSFSQHSAYNNLLFLATGVSGLLMFVMLWHTYQLKLARLAYERAVAEEHALRLNQMYSALNQCNQAIVRCSDETQLFHEIVRNAVSFGGMKMAWIGLADTQTNTLKPVAYAGEGTGYLNGLEISLDIMSPSGHGPSGIVYHQDIPFWCQDFQNDSATFPWHERAKEFGWMASAALPLHQNGQVIGTINFYADRVNAFDDLVKKLLIEMTDDIDNALINFDHVKKQKQIQEELRESQQRLEAIIQNEPECVKVVDIRGRLLEMNPAGLAMLEAQTLEEAQEHRLVDFLVAEHRAAFIALHKQVMNGENALLEFEIIGLNGTHRWLETHATPMRDSGGNVISLLGVTRDITERKFSENELFKRNQAMEQSPNSIIITDFKANIEYVNAAFVQNTGYRAEEVMGKNPRFLKSGRTPPHAYDQMWSALIRQEKWQGEFINKRKDNSEYIYSINVAPVIDSNGRTTHYIAIEEDISEQKRTQERIHYLANFDVLTGLPNRIQMDELMSYTLSLAKRNEGRFALMFLDLDHFKDINDTLGHSLGDALLVELAKRLTSVLRNEDTVSRMGGDEFVLLLPNADSNGAAQVCQKLLETIGRPFYIEDHELSVTASIGLAFYPSDGVTIEALSKNADAAMYRAKQEGRNAYCFFTEEMQVNSQRNLQLASALHSALERNEFHLVYQPQLSLTGTKVIGAEALLRWEHPKLGMVPPSEFIPIAEDNGMIQQIGEWVLETAVKQAKEWQRIGLPPLIMAVNISAVQFRNPNLPDVITKTLHTNGLSPEYLELELTEGVAMHDPKSAIIMMESLHSLGIRMSIDDFGTGYSSLSHLKKFNIYKLKIDQSFVRDISTDPEDKAIVGAIIQMAHSLELVTIAEGVETINQLEYLREQGCDEVQGYYYSKPVVPKDFEKFVQNLQ